MMLFIEVIEIFDVLDVFYGIKKKKKVYENEKVCLINIHKSIKIS